MSKTLEEMAERDMQRAIEHGKAWDDVFTKLFDPPTKRRHKADPGECIYCDQERTVGTDFHPPHDASDLCESGRHNHCSCDWCF